MSDKKPGHLSENALDDIFERIGREKEAVAQGMEEERKKKEAEAKAHRPFSGSSLVLDENVDLDEEERKINEMLAAERAKIIDAPELTKEAVEIVESAEADEAEQEASKEDGIDLLELTAEDIKAIPPKQTEEDREADKIVAEAQTIDVSVEELLEPDTADDPIEEDLVPGIAEFIFADDIPPVAVKAAPTAPKEVLDNKSKQEVGIDVEILGEPLEDALTVEIVAENGIKAKGFLIASAKKNEQSGYAYFFSLDDGRKKLDAKNGTNPGWQSAIASGLASLAACCNKCGVTHFTLFARKSACKLIQQIIKGTIPSMFEGIDKNHAERARELLKDVQVDLTYQEDLDDEYLINFVSMSAQFIIR